MPTGPMGYENGTSSHFDDSSCQELTSLGRAKQRSSSGGGAISRERLSECERLAGRDTQVDSETSNEREEGAYERLRGCCYAPQQHGIGAERERTCSLQVP